ncbi:hypothetical protein Q5762_00300 [Streptomyces sp. P9(2023)]|uniref:hypothetical protein n=1 Tax=Streptomyces sp. P9(2023) TaxID=3064394 RepID=UPI0028F40381|nr:hypothetical protein [Streptomyces sp. P9(2023)]MDT9686815.1 hypothetical protein [Streptomyces sp. P9(2023)]
MPDAQHGRQRAHGERVDDGDDDLAALQAGGPAGRTPGTVVTPGETRHFTFGSGDFLLHDLENTGDAPLVFVTVEFIRSANLPLRLEP